MVKSDTQIGDQQIIFSNKKESYPRISIWTSCYSLFEVTQITLACLGHKKVQHGLTMQGWNTGFRAEPGISTTWYTLNWSTRIFVTPHFSQEAQVRT